MVKKIGLALLCFLVLWIMYHQLMIRFESKALDGPFEYVEVGDKQLHLYDSKIGENTIVMLPGYGTGSPIHDLMLIVKFLEKDYRVIVIEPLGYGNSQTTKKERTIENILEEYREALKKQRPSHHMYFFHIQYPASIVCTMPECIQMKLRLL